MAKATHEDVIQRARDILDQESVPDFVWDICADTCQMLDNVRHMRWFLIAVANELINTVVKYRHLTPIHL